MKSTALKHLQRGKGGIMEGRYPHGLLLAITNCTDPSQEEEFNAWYNHRHVPDVTAPGIFRYAIRFVNTDPSSQAGTYVATYETNWEDVSKAMPAHREASGQLRERGDRGTPSIQVVRSGVFKRLGGGVLRCPQAHPGHPAGAEQLQGPGQGSGVQPLVRGHPCGRHPGDGGLPHRLSVREPDPPQATKTKYLALYETEQSDPAKAREAMRKARADWEKRGRLSDTIEVVASLTARRLWPLD